MLSDYRAKGKITMGDKVLVVGGGSVAADAAMTARENGAKEVVMVCLEKKDEMPALASEIKELKKEGVTLHNGWGPKAVTEEGKLTFKACTSVFDEQGRFAPAYDESKTLDVAYDQLVIAVGQAVESSLAEHLKQAFNTTGLLEVDQKTMAVKDHPGIYAGGDIVRGAGTIAEAVGDGRRAAMAIVELLK